jgi:hypothetical protein
MSNIELYVVSKVSNRYFALNQDNVIQVCHFGPDPLNDAKSYAYDYTRNTGQPAWVWQVEDLEAVCSYREQKEVVFVPAK